MSRSRVSRAVLALCLALGSTSCGGGDGAQPGATRDWNVLVITIDTLRADHLGFAGYDGADTPVLDGLADAGAVFEDAVSGAPVTLPSHSTIFTGLNSPRHGALDNGFYSLPEDVPTMADVLHAAGYETAAVVGAYVLHAQYGLDSGFEHYDDRFRQPRSDADEHLERPADVVVDRALEWLDGRDPDRPFLLWTHFFDPHAPYEPPRSFRMRFATRPYDGEIAFTDEQIGRLLTGLTERGLRERTLVVLTADHGEAMGDGGEKTHGLLLRRTTLHVPLVVHAPGAVPSCRVPGVVSTADILPTVLELAGVAAPEDLDGISLLPAIAAKVSRGRLAYSETRLPEDLYGWSMLAGVRNDDWAYVRGPIPELYDVPGDPGERNNVHAERPEEARVLDERVGAVLAQQRDVAPGNIGAREVEALRALGYVVDTEVAQSTGVDPKERLDAWNRVNDLRQLLPARRFREVVEGMEAVLAEDPGNREARMLLGQALIGAGRAEEGLEQFRFLAERGWALGRSGILFARSLAESGHPEEAESLLRSFEELEPKFAEHPFNLGVLLNSLG
ncbi:MAG TPA: sulfatase-like hydrolase/transferase, partial [bacterium]|nr:sulfatase-like hydrolase/transferase [bacterium]